MQSKYSLHLIFTQKIEYVFWMQKHLKGSFYTLSDLSHLTKPLLNIAPCQNNSSCPVINNKMQNAETMVPVIQIPYSKYCVYYQLNNEHLIRKFNRFLYNINSDQHVGLPCSLLTLRVLTGNDHIHPEQPLLRTMQTFRCRMLYKRSEDGIIVGLYKLYSLKKWTAPHHLIIIPQSKTQEFPMFYKKSHSGTEKQFLMPANKDEPGPQDFGVPQARFNVSIDNRTPMDTNWFTDHTYNDGVVQQNGENGLLSILSGSELNDYQRLLHDDPHLSVGCLGWDDNLPRYVPHRKKIEWQFWEAKYNRVNWCRDLNLPPFQTLNDLPKEHPENQKLYHILQEKEEEEEEVNKQNTATETPQQIAQGQYLNAKPQSNEQSELEHKSSDNEEPNQQKGQQVSPEHELQVNQPNKGQNRNQQIQIEEIFSEDESEKNQQNKQEKTNVVEEVSLEAEPEKINQQNKAEKTDVIEEVSLEAEPSINPNQSQKTNANKEESSKDESEAKDTRKYIMLIDTPSEYIKAKKSLEDIFKGDSDIEIIEQDNDSDIEIINSGSRKRNISCITNDNSNHNHNVSRRKRPRM